MIKTITLSMCLAASLLSLDARAQDTLTRDALAQNDRQYTDGPVTEVDYIQVEYGHFAEYIDWLNSTCDHDRVKMTALLYGFDQSRRIFRLDHFTR